MTGRQTTSVGAGSIGYDGKGNLNSTGSNSYTYSSENLLLTGPSSASLAYDPILRLYQESGSSVATRLFQYDGQAMIGEYDTSRALQRRYVHGPGTDEPLVEYDKSGGSYTRVWLHADERGSIVAQSNDSGTTTAIDSYDEYGVPASGNAGRFGYTGQVRLPSLGLWYYKARMYSAGLGRFMQTDPIGYGDGMNWYNYVGGDPINTTDSNGLSKFLFADGIVYEKVCAAVEDPSGNYKLNCAYRRIGYTTSTSDGGTLTFDPITGGRGGGERSASNDRQCTDTQRAAANLAKVFEQNAAIAGGISLGSAVVTAASGAGEGPSLGADTPLTATAAAATGFFGTASLVFDGISAGLETFAKGGDPASLGNLAIDEMAGLAAKAGASKVPGLSQWAEVIEKLASKLSSVKRKADEACK